MAHSCSVDAENCDFGGIDNVSYASPIFPKKSYVETWGQYSKCDELPLLHTILMYLTYPMVKMVHRMIKTTGE